MLVPAGITGWFQSQYPQVRFNTEWLEECYKCIVERHPGAGLPVLIKQMEGQLLRSDLADSTVHHAGLLPDEEGETGTLFVADGTSRNKNAAAVLVQILEVLEIGRPALELLDIHRNRVEDKKVLREQGRQVRRAVAHVEHDEGGAGTGNPAGATQQGPNADQDEPATTIGVKGFPRAMLRLRVSDGFTEYVAIENKRVHTLSLEDTMLGSKLLLKNIRCLRGILMLDEPSCAFKGGHIAELEKDRDELLERALNIRIRGHSGDEQQNARQGIQHRQVQADPPRPNEQRQTNARPNASAALPRAPPTPSRSSASANRGQAANKVKGRANNRAYARNDKKEVEEDFDGMLDDLEDEIDEDELDALRAMENEHQHHSQAQAKTKRQPSGSVHPALLSGVANGRVQASKKQGTIEGWRDSVQPRSAKKEMEDCDVLAAGDDGIKHDDEEDESFWAAAGELAEASASGRSGMPSTSAAQSHRALPSKVIDIDIDSSSEMEEEEIAQLVASSAAQKHHKPTLIKQERAGISRAPPQHPGKAAPNPIEIDSD